MSPFFSQLLSELFRHALSPNSTLLLIAISNTVTDRIDTGLTLSSDERAGIPPSVVFEAFGADDLTKILKSEVNGAISVRAHSPPLTIPSLTCDHARLGADFFCRALLIIGRRHQEARHVGVHQGR